MHLLAESIMIFFSFVILIVGHELFCFNFFLFEKVGCDAIWMIIGLIETKIEWMESSFSWELDAD